MKLKKLLISASAVAAGSGLLATVLTSCAKANVDEKLKITLDDNGLLYKAGNLGDTAKIDFKTAIQNALLRSNSWTQFKTAVADEIVYQWYLDRAAPDKSSDKKNSNFRNSIDEWNYQIGKDYDGIVQTCKNKYGANWPFYLQNEYLAPYGGTEAAYKHAKLVDKVKADFVTKVFAKNYFGYKNGTYTAIPEYEHIFVKASREVNKTELRNPENWGNIGFFARADLSFPISEADIPTSYDKIDPSFLAKHPEGDYAAIQDYVFNRWFKTEKPFFAAAALFKYSMPKYVAGAKLDQVYNATRTGVKLPDKPNEAFPFFGAGDDGSTRKAVDFLQDMAASKFATPYTNKSGSTIASNGTVTIPVTGSKYSDDSQTLLLVSGNQMFTKLYTPYAMTMGNLYAQMMGDLEKTSNPNHLAAATVAANINAWKQGVVDDFAMLSNFFYTADPTASGITNTLDLSKIYPSTTTDGVYHSTLFAECPSYEYFYGNVNNKVAGIKYITNNIQVDDFAYSTVAADVQPWVMELNEAGVHIQTIDGFASVKAETTSEKKLAQLKKLVMYRLMQKQTNDEAAASISTSLLGESGELKTYFNDNYANIIIELATIDKAKYPQYNVFRKIDSYKEDQTTRQNPEKDLFLYNIMVDESLSASYANLVGYFNAIIGYEMTKKNFSNLETANSKIYSYRSKQITNSKNTEQFSKTIFENGLLAPFVYAPTYDIEAAYDYDTVNRVVVQGYEDVIEQGYVVAIAELQDELDKNSFVKEVVENATVNGSTGWSPQIAAAKAATSNRFWYKSAIVDKLMHSYMGNKAFTANAIKKNAYEYYTEKMGGTPEWFTERIANRPEAINAFATTYARSKLITAEKNISYYISPTDISSLDLDGFYTAMNYFFSWYFMEKDYLDNGINSDERLNYDLLWATIMYLYGSDKDEAEAKPFDNFYTVLNSKVSEDEAAIIGYMTRGYTTGGSHVLSDDPIVDIQDKGSANYDYDFDPKVDNDFDRFGYSGRTPTYDEGESKLTSSSYWNAVHKTINGVTRDFSGFLGIQTKASNQIDSGSGLQAAVFDNFAKATYDSRNLNVASTSANPKYAQNEGCWFKFAGKLTADLKPIDFKFSYDGTEVTADTWFPIDSQYAPVRKVARKIIEYRTMDDLKTLAKTLANSFDGYSYFSAIADGSEVCASTDEMKMKMLKLLPSAKSSEFEHAHDIKCFNRVSNAEAHTADINPVYAFKDSKTKNSYKLLLTQINKADITEKNLAPEWKDNKWTQTSTSPITPEEFFVILFNLASESTVQQRVITEVVKKAFGDEKLIVYDAQLYNQFDSVWIKDWTKKTMGA